MQLSVPEVKICIFISSDVDDIDVFAGGVAETPLDGAAVGPLFSCIIGNQFRDMKEGDRYWYENRGREGFRRGKKNKIIKPSSKRRFCSNRQNV